MASDLVRKPRWADAESEVSVAGEGPSVTEQVPPSSAGATGTSTVAGSGVTHVSTVHGDSRGPADIRGDGASQVAETGVGSTAPQPEKHFK